MVRFHPDTARVQVDEEHGVRMRTAICGNGWVLQKRAGCRQKQYRLEKQITTDFSKFTFLSDNFVHFFFENGDRWDLVFAT